ncbi:MAG: hypothetical protein RR620_12100 [Clostridium sp.]
MKRFFIIANGSNDLYYSISYTLSGLIDDMQSLNDIEIYVFYSILNTDYLNIWTRIENDNILNEIRAFKVTKGMISEINYYKYYRSTEVDKKKINIMAPDLFIKDFLEEEHENIVILCGHGGLFQSFLDMSISPCCSLNTITMLNRLKGYKIDLLFLDMCSMNYLEIFYEVLKDSKIKNLLTYKDLAPFEGVSYNELIKIFNNKRSSEENIIEFMKSSKVPLVYSNIKKISNLENVKSLQNDIAKECIYEEMPKFDVHIKMLNNEIKKAVKENSESLNIHKAPLNFIRYYLKEREERELYNQYSLGENNLWRYFITKTVSHKIDRKLSLPEVIRLDVNSLEHIIWLHNSNLNKNQLQEKLLELKKVRGEL